MNPYRATEYTIAVACVLLVVAVVAAIAYVITVTESWKSFGITALVIAAFCALGILQARWDSIESWWVRKRSEWDEKKP